MADKEYIEREAVLTALMNEGCTANNIATVMNVPAADVAPRSELAKELFALRAVAYGCNTNPKLRGYNASFLDRDTNETVSFEEALNTVYALIERLTESPSNNETAKE